jgi:hypothetical protein
MFFLSSYQNIESSVLISNRAVFASSETIVGDKLEGTFSSDSTARFATATPKAILFMMSFPPQRTARVPPTKQSPAPVRHKIDAGKAGKCKQLKWRIFCPDSLHLAW